MPIQLAVFEMFGQEFWTLFFDIFQHHSFIAYFNSLVIEVHKYYLFTSNWTVCFTSLKK